LYGKNFLLDLLLQDPDICALQIYSFVFGAIPFMGLDMESLVAQMVGFVEELPKGWQQKWELMQVHSGYTRIPLTGELASNPCCSFSNTFSTLAATTHKSWLEFLNDSSRF